MGVANPPLEQWQIDHIRKMQEDLGMPSEERPMDETDYMDQTPDDEGTAYPATGGGLGAPDAYNAYQAAQKRVDAQIKANIDLLTDAQKRLRERRAGPSNAEKWFSIAAALGKPTRTGSFGESLGNLNEVLAKQNAMKREAQEERDALLEQYGMKIGGEQLRMLQSGATQAGQIYRAEMAARKPKPSSWSENMSQFVSPDKPVATRNTVRVGNYNLTQYTDGSLRLRNPDGSYSVYTEDGVKVGDIPAGGVQ